PPAVVKVPGRTHPVSIHHSKVTELDDYEKAATDKVCKIHRKLPTGGILVFLTGKQEIVRMVNRLRQKLDSSRNTKSRSVDIEQTTDVNETNANYSQDVDDFDDSEKYDIVVEAGNVDDDKQPKKVQILPLYSMLSAEEQAKVFTPVPDDTRLIVIATNIAETSITIPGISYVVDCGRQKCRNYHAGTGVASYDVMWISKAAAD
ncbi:predicted protein, partial [Thalassiosira pseudonana CCMP1335]